MPRRIARCASVQCAWTERPLGEKGARNRRVLEYGVRVLVFYGDLREHKGESGIPRKPTGSLFCFDRRPLEIYGKRNLGTL